MAKHKSEHQQNVDDSRQRQQLQQYNKHRTNKVATTEIGYNNRRTISMYSTSVRNNNNEVAPILSSAHRTLHYSLCLFVFTRFVYALFFFFSCLLPPTFLFFLDDFSICLLVNTMDITACGAK